MAIHPQVFVPPLVVAHVLGFVLLGYSLEKVFGVFSKLIRAVRPSTLLRKAPECGLAHLQQPKLPLEANEAPPDGQHNGSSTDWDSSLEARARTGLVQAPQFRVLSQPWVRGCHCEVWALMRLFASAQKKAVLNVALTKYRMQWTTGIHPNIDAFFIASAGWLQAPPQVESQRRGRSSSRG